MLEVLQAMAARARHICRQSGARLCNGNDDHSCGCCCWPTSNGTGSSSSSSSSSSSNNACRSRYAGLCCGWLYSLIFGWDWLPLATTGGPVSRAGGHAQGGVLGGTASLASRGVGSGSGSVGAGGGGGGSGSGSDIAVAVASGDPGGTGMRRLGSSSSSTSGGGGGGGGGGEDVKPLLTHSKSAEFREKEKRFIKGRFVLPGSDVQRRIAEAMAGMLAAGGRAMTGNDGASNSGSGGGAVGPNRNAGVLASGDGEGYQEIIDEDSPTSEGNEGEFQFSASTSLSSLPPSTSSSSQEAGPRAGGAIGAGSCHASPKRNPSSRRDVGFVSGVGSGGGRGVDHQQEDERECVICMEEFSKDDPAMLTLCSCGVNKTFFHYSCLLQWLSKHSYCPACRGYLFFEERRPGENRSRDDGRTTATATNSTRGGSTGLGPLHGARSSPGAQEGFRGASDEASLSSDEYGRAFRRALRAGLDHPLSSPGHGEGAAESS